MRAFDVTVLEALNGFARHSEPFDAFAVMVAFNDLLKGGIAAAVLVWLWFAAQGDDVERDERRSALLATLAATGIALALNRTLATWLPFRVRPLDDPDLAFAPPYGIHDAPTFSDLSAFPSDHAVMFIALATGVFMASRRAGLLLFLHAAVLVLPVRLYLGLHWPSDVLAGAVLGAVFAALFACTPLRRWIARPFLSWERRHRASFYALFFLVMLEVAELFDSCVAVGYWVLRVTGHSGVL